MSKTPNVVIIYADDLGYGDLSCYGAEDVKTPNIDALLEHGVRFDSGYSTSAVCTPARYSLLTGEYPFRNQYTKYYQVMQSVLYQKSKKHFLKCSKKQDIKRLLLVNGI